MTVEEFLQWDSGDGRRYELIDGDPRAMAPASNTHGLLQMELGALIHRHLRATRPGCEVITNPGVVPHLLSDHNLRIPDLAVTCVPVLPGPNTLPDPVLIVEILSPSNQAETWANVRASTSIPSVQEILILRSDKRSAGILRRLDSGGWPSEPTTLAGGELDLKSIDLRLSLAELYARTGLAG
jgi:Uma2 family endonuclease